VLPDARARATLVPGDFFRLNFRLAGAEGPDISPAGEEAPLVSLK